MSLSDALPRDPGGLVSFLGAAYRRFEEDRCLQTAGSLAFTTLLALVPAVTVALALVTAFPVFGQWTSGLDDWLAENVLPEAIADAITKYVAQFTSKAARLTAVGLVFLALTALALMLTIERALNRIFRVSRERPVAQRLLAYWAMLTLGPLLMGAGLSMTSYLVSASLGWTRGVPGAGAALLRTAPVLLEIAAITLLYLWVPNRRLRLAHALAGGAVAGALFEAMKYGFAVYIARVPTYSAIYGAFAAVPLFLLWLYLSWVAVLAGAVIAAMLPGYRGRERRGDAAGGQFFDALALLAELARAQRVGETRSLEQLARQRDLAPEQCERLLARMEGAGWVARSSGERWLLARAAEAIAAADVYRLFVLDERAAEAPLAPLLAGHLEDVARRLPLRVSELAAADR
ncbi:MAG: YihY family inner membrane protein [Burkholderiales bacterium]|nr:YihY family inner membrane protein [Burkholderiales bacterium]